MRQNWDPLWGDVEGLADPGEETGGELLLGLEVLGEVKY